MQTETKPTKNVPLSQSMVIAELRKEAAKSPVFSNVMHVFALRERARQQVTIPALRLRMGSEGFNYTRHDYMRVLRFLASVGLGTLELSAGEVIALKNVKITLQSIGMAAVSNGDKLTPFTPQYDYQTLEAPKRGHNIVKTPPVQNTADTSEIKLEPSKSTSNQKTHPATLTIVIDGKAISFPLPSGVTTAQLGELLAEFHSRSHA